MLVTQAEFAAIKGVSKPTVCTAMKSRIAAAIVMQGSRRMLDRDLALELWDQNTQRNNNAKVSPAAKERDRKPASEPPSGDQLRSMIMGLPEDAIPGLDVSRERREHYQAELAKLQAFEKREELMAAVKQEGYNLGRQIRDNVMGIRDRISPLLAAAQDTAEVYRLLTDELTIALRMLPDG